MTRCAIYTRKSTDEGLDQAFNTLDAQREACEAYIASQAGEGWRLVKRRYDDGGWSGGTMDRPALARLLADIEASRIDTILVYKVDRLTRSLADFARIVELFDAHDVSFVSITQQFNTTTSMGRLTLNMLLSFAQFEREVTGERIRDKIAASKKKGMWMGGVVPLGYDVIDRKLIINDPEAKTVRTIFQLYRDLANVSLVKEQTDRLNLRTKRREPNYGRRQGGTLFSHGHIYKLLSNAMYVGDIVHKGVRYPGEHEGIIDEECWAAVQEQLQANRVPRYRKTNFKSLSLLAGLLFDEDGNRLSPSHSNKEGRRYRYYVTRKVPGTQTKGDNAWRLPAPMVEEVVLNEICRLLRDRLRLTSVLKVEDLDMEGSVPAAARLGKRLPHDDPADQRDFFVEIVRRIELRRDRIKVTLARQTLLKWICHGRPDENSEETNSHDDDFTIRIPVELRRRGVEKKLIITDDRERPPAPDPHLIKAIAQGHHWFTQIKTSDINAIRDLAECNGINQGDISRILRLGLLAPDIVEAILAGKQPVELTAKRLKRIGELPISWAEQRRVLGFV